MTNRDAVLVLPGIMGSELVDATDGTVLWGLADPRWYVRAWGSGASLDRLKVTDDERAGRTGRVRASRLLAFPAFAPMLRGMEPYTALVAGVRRAVAHPDAVLTFAYDWRLPVAHNAAGLARAAERHLDAWRAHPHGSRDAKLTLVAHSMGGLVAKYFTTVLGGARDVRTTITLGTPFHGSVKAAAILGTGRGGPLPLPRGRLRALAATLPGVHDLLPSYRCVDEGTSARPLTPADVAALGGDLDLARDSAALHGELARHHCPLRTLVGVDQPTAQSLVLGDGAVELRDYTCEPGESGGLTRVDRLGDGTVYRDSAAGGVPPAYLPQAHGALAKTAEALAHVRSVLTEATLGPPLGATPLGLALPDVVTAGEPFEIEARTAAEPAAVTCRITGAAGEGVSRPVFGPRDGSLVARTRLPAPGLYRVEAKSGGYSAVSELVLAVGEPA